MRYLLPADLQTSFVGSLHRSVALVDDARALIALETQAAQEHGHIGALSAVVGVELVKHEIREAARALPPQGPVLVTEQQLVEHLIVREQDVRRLVADDSPIGDESVGADPRPLRAGLASVEGGGDPG